MPLLPGIFMSERKKAFHILTLKDASGTRSVALDAATVSIGRDPNNTIVLTSKAVSRQHAILLRLPLPGGGYRYRLLDGNSSGKPSTNGIIVNGKRCSAHDLNSGDALMFGGQVKASYQVLPADQAKYAKYMNVHALDFHSIKIEPINSKATYIGEELDESPVLNKKSNALDALLEEDEMELTELFYDNSPKS
jgi:pSer/pThr/pTyr-binding forkhead associated (FHA) protein